MVEKLRKAYVKGLTFVSSNKGFGIKEMAATLGAIVVIGLVISVINTNKNVWLGEVWDKIMDFIDVNVTK